jgi:acyl-CoA thioesterase FadM
MTHQLCSLNPNLTKSFFMRWLRLVLALIAAKYRSKLSITDSSVFLFSVWPTDVDASIMNHASLMTVMEAGRIDLMVRAGFFKLARKKKWYFPTSAISVQFIRPLKLFQKATLLTKVWHVTETAIYLKQTVKRGDKMIAVCLVKGTIKKGREALNIPLILHQLDNTILPNGDPDLIETFEKQNARLKEIE